MQHFRQIFRSSPGLACAVVCAWLTLGVAPCLAAAPVEQHDHHDCPHCETVVVEAASCDLPSDAILSSANEPDNQPAALPAGFPPAPVAVRLAIDFAPPGAPPPERSRLHRFCRLLE
ncbi:MAG TPA: hypothetical protein VF254_02520 [Gammaproteobacteria bacterium]